MLRIIDPYYEIHLLGAYWKIGPICRDKILLHVNKRKILSKPTGQLVRLTSQFYYKNKLKIGEDDQESEIAVRELGQFTSLWKSSHLYKERCSYKLRKIHRKTFWIKLQAWGLFFCEFYEIRKNTFFTEHLGQLLLSMERYCNIKRVICI